MKRSGLFLLLFPSLVLPFSVLAESKLDSRVFAGKAADEPASFLLVLRDQADLSAAQAISDRTERLRYVYETLQQHADRTQAVLRERLKRLDVPFRPFFLVNMLEVEADRSVAAELASRDDVELLAPNLPARMPPEPLVPEPNAPTASSHVSGLASYATVEPNVAKIRAPEVWSQGFTGQGIVIGMADTGFVWNHPALKSHYRGFDGVSVSHDYNWHDAIHNALPGNPCGSDASAPCDDDGHGTSTTGVAVGDDGAGNRIGVAPGARFIGCRNMDRGSGTPARYTECFQFFLAPTDRSGRNPRPELAAHVISNSWGCPASEGCTDPNILKTVVENVRAAGIFVVVSAGNGGPSCSTVTEVPASYEASFSVGATDTLSDAIARFSSRGPVTVDGSNRLKPDLSAPGVGVRSAVGSDSYRSSSGTSLSAPHVTGAVALLWSAAPQLLGRSGPTADLLRRTALPLTSSQDCDGFSGAAVPNTVFGFGRLDVSAAVAAATVPARATPLPPPRRGRVRVVEPRP